MKALINNITEKDFTGVILAGGDNLFRFDGTHEDKSIYSIEYIDEITADRLQVASHPSLINIFDDLVNDELYIAS